MIKKKHFVFVITYMAISFASNDIEAEQPTTPQPVSSHVIEKLQTPSKDDVKKEEPADPRALQTLPQQQKSNAELSTKIQDLDEINIEQETIKKDIYLNFENTSLANFVNYMAEIRKLNIIPDKGIEETKISLTIRDPLSTEGAWNVFLTVLETSGFAIVKAGEVWKVLPKDRKLTEALPSYINVSPDTLPDNDLEIRYVMFLENIKVGDVRDLLGSMLSNPNSIIDHQDANAFIITDKALNIKSATKMLLELDRIGLQETVTVIRLQKANAMDVSELLGALIKKQDANPLARLLGKSTESAAEYFSSTTKIIPEERTNSLILLGDNASIDRLINFITRYIDTALTAAESPLHIYECKHTDAEQIKAILEEVTQTPESGVGQAAGKYGAIRGGVKYFKPMKFQVDKEGNRLIISCTDHYDWKLLKKTIKDLDKPQPQVAIETLIVTINSNDIKNLGGMIRNKKHGQIGHNIDFQSTPLVGSPSLQGPNDNPISLLGNLFNQLTLTQGAMLVSIGKVDNIWSVFRVLRQQTNATVMAQPFLTVTNKASASLKVGEERQVISETGETTNSYERVPVHTSINVTPQINLDGLIRLDMDVSIQNFGDNQGKIRLEKTVKTGITVANGQVLVLGGFVKTRASESKAKTPLLGDIPVLGWLFKRQDRTVSKDYIFIFMVPTIVKPRQLPGTELYTKMKMHAATSSIEDSVDTTMGKDPIHNWFFNPEKENYSHKVIDFANARYQPTTVDIINDPYYRSKTQRQELEENKKQGSESKLRRHTLELDSSPLAQEQQKPIENKKSKPSKKTEVLRVTEPEKKSINKISLISQEESREKKIKQLPMNKNDSSKDENRSLLKEKDSKKLISSKQKTPLTKTNPAKKIEAKISQYLDVESKRKKLKALLNGLSQPDNESKKSEQQINDQEKINSQNITQKEKREKLKEELSKELSTDSQKQSDENYEQKREKLKQTITTDNPNDEGGREKLKSLITVPGDSNVEESIEQKRQKLKTILENEEAELPLKSKTPQLSSTSKRNRLKEFLAEQEDLEKTSSVGTMERKVAA